MSNKNKTFEDCYEEIYKTVESRRFRWKLTAVPSISWEDIRQILLIHISKKWHLYDQNRPLKSWLLTVIHHRLTNVLRDVYLRSCRPCLRCPFYEGDDLCYEFGNVSTRCDVYRDWTHGKKNAHDIRLPLPIEHHQNEVYDITSTHIDIAKTATNIHKKMQGILKPLEWLVYKELFIKHTEEKDVAKMLGFKTTEKNRIAGYKQLNNIRKGIINKVKDVLKDIDIIN